jgi:hypothetical protein
MLAELKKRQFTQLPVIDCRYRAFGCCLRGVHSTAHIISILRLQKQCSTLTSLQDKHCVKGMDSSECKHCTNRSIVRVFGKN